MQATITCLVILVINVTYGEGPLIEIRLKNTHYFDTQPILMTVSKQTHNIINDKRAPLRPFHWNIY